MAFKVLKPDASLDENVRTHISDSIEQNFKKWALNGLWLLISVILGYLISTVWDLNGKIYEVAGKQDIQYDVIDKLRHDIKELEDENERLKADKVKLEQSLLSLQGDLNKAEGEKAKLQSELNASKGKSK